LRPYMGNTNIDDITGGGPINGISLNIRGYSMIFHLYRLEDIPYSGVICNIISNFFLRSAYSPCRAIRVEAEEEPAGGFVTFT